MSFTVFCHTSADHLVPSDGTESRPTSKVLGSTSDSRVVNISLAAGACLAEHSSAQPILVYVLMGEIVFSCDGREVILGEGGLVSVDRHVPHAVRAIKPSSIMVVFLT